MNPAALPYVLLAGLFFGTSLLSARFGIGQFAPVTFTGLRLLLAGSGFLAVYALDRRRHPWPLDAGIWRHSLLLSFLGVIIPLFGTILALQYLSSGLTAMFVTVGPALTVVLAHFFLADESLTTRKAVGVLLALSGALLLALRGESGLPNVEAANPTGYLLMLATLVSVSASTIYVRKFMGGYRSFDVSSTQILVAALLAGPLVLAFTGFHLEVVDWRGYAALGYSALAGTILAVLVYNYSISKFGATSAAMTQYIVPIVAGAGGILLLGEQISAGMLAGVALIVVGVTLVRLTS